MYTQNGGTGNEAIECEAGPQTQTPAVGSSKNRKSTKALGARTETEAIERALEIVIGEAEKNRRAWAATEKLVKNGIQIKDVFGRLDEK